MKRMNKFFAIAAVLVFSSIAANACDIEIEIEKGKKATYAKGDVITVEVDVESTHRNCDKSIKDVKLTPENMEIISATKWVKDDDDNDWKRKLKVKITDTSKGFAKLTAERKCPKNGGKETLYLNVK